MTQSTVFVLGGDDAEMAAIRELVAGHTVLQATKDGLAVHGGNAYEATWMAWPDGRPVKVSEYAHLARTHAVVLIECGGASPFPHEGQTVGAGDGIEGGRSHPVKVVRIDHHRPGDPGYGKPPEEFLLASSIGQVYRHLEGGSFRWQAAGGATDQPAWFVVGADGHGRFVPQAVLLTAAADHCLGHAYAGRCPGVDPDALLRHRAAEKAAFQKRPVEAVLADIEVARKEIRDVFDVVHSADCDRVSFDCPGCYAIDRRMVRRLIDFRDRFIPLLPEAASMAGVGYVTTVTEPGGRVKDVVGGAAAPDRVRWWLADMRAAGRQVYGDPERGFAGAYR